MTELQPHQYEEDGEKDKMNKSQQESWRRELSRIYTKHEHYFQDINNEGFAQYDYDKIFADFESLISTQRQRVLNEVEENLKFNQPKEFDTQTFRNYIAVEIDKLRKLNEK